MELHSCSLGFRLYEHVQVCGGDIVSLMLELPRPYLNLAHCLNSLIFNLNLAYCLKCSIG
jgi:hypothetical protein